MLTSSRDIVRRLLQDGWVEVRVKGSHHVFKHEAFRQVISVMHPQKDPGNGLVRQITRTRAGKSIEQVMAHYIAIVEDSGPDHAVGVWFPDLPGCFSAGDDLDDAMRNAPEALALYVEGMDTLPSARSLSKLKADPKVAEDMKNYMFAVIEVSSLAHAAE